MEQKKYTAVEWLEIKCLGLMSFDSEELRAKYKEIVKQAKEIEKQERMYSEEDVLNFAQIIISQYKFGNTNIEQIDLLKNTLNAFKEALDLARNFKKE